jgi:hypothetical protein
MINTVAGGQDYIWQSQKANARLVAAILEINWNVCRQLPIDYASSLKARGESWKRETQLLYAWSVERFVAGSHMISLCFEGIFIKNLREK